MSYVLDGIETAMEASESGSEPGCATTTTAVDCPCGWHHWWRHAGAFYAGDVPGPTEADRAALRFHYTHCPKAKKRDTLSKWQ